MMPPARNQIKFSTGAPLVANAIEKLDHQWSAHFNLLKSMVGELSKQSSCLKPLTPLKVTQTNKGPPLIANGGSRIVNRPIQPEAGGRITRSMAKRGTMNNNRELDRQDPGPEKSAKGPARSKKEPQEALIRNGTVCPKPPRIRTSMIKEEDESLKENNGNCTAERSDLLSDGESFKSPSSSLDKQNSSKKQSGEKKNRKRKPTQYFTPSCPAKSCRRTRAAARAEAQLTNSATKSKQQVHICPGSHKKSPYPKMNSIAKPASVTSSSSSIAPAISKSNPLVSRTPDTKQLTNSAMKRRKEEEEKRKEQWKAIIEKEQKALAQKKKNIEEKQMNSKMKNDEKKKRFEKLREQKEKEQEEKRLKEQEKLEDIERRRREKEERNKQEAIRHQEMLKLRQQQNDIRKQEEEEDRKLKLLRQEMNFKKKQEEIEKKKREENEVFRIIKEHNAAVKAPLTKMPSNSNLGSLKSVAMMPKDDIGQPVLNSTYSKDGEKDQEVLEAPVGILDAQEKAIFKVPQSLANASIDSSQTTPKRPSPVNYDISDIKSDDGTDDDEAPRKPIPSWAQAPNLLESLSKQYSVSARRREAAIKEIFPKIELPIDLGKIFDGARACVPRYEKRTSSAVWNSPNMSAFNFSLISDI